MTALSAALLIAALLMPRAVGARAGRFAPAASGRGRRDRLRRAAARWRARRRRSTRRSATTRPTTEPASSPRRTFERSTASCAPRPSRSCARSTARRAESRLDRLDFGHAGDLLDGPGDHLRDPGAADPDALGQGLRALRRFRRRHVAPGRSAAVRSSSATSTAGRSSSRSCSSGTRSCCSSIPGADRARPVALGLAGRLGGGVLGAGGLSPSPRLLGLAGC